MPAWPPTVPQDLYDSVAELMGEPYADSYLWGATLAQDMLTPRTVTAWERLGQVRIVMSLLDKRRIKLVKPVPFGMPGGSMRSFAEVVEDAPRPKRGRRPEYDAW